MKVLLLGFVRIAHMPYMYDYVSLLNGDHELHLISWNRNGKEDASVPKGVCRSFVFDDRIEDADPIQKKLPHFVRFRKFALSVIESEKYDRIVVLHSTPGITILDQLSDRYKGKYVLDYRDVSHENYGFYRRLILKLSQNAGLVIASSPSYLKYLSNERGVFLKHNLLKASYEHREGEVSRCSDAPIRVRYWGMIRHERANRAMIDALGGDPRFELHYNGREEEVAIRLKRYVAQRSFSNVFFHGPYYSDERAEFALETDIIHNVYENDFATIGALGNKLYDGIQFKIPQLCTAGSAMGDYVTERGLGLAIDYNKPGFKEQIVNYFSTIDYQAFDMACEHEFDAVLADNNNTDTTIKDFFK